MAFVTVPLLAMARATMPTLAAVVADAVSRRLMNPLDVPSIRRADQGLECKLKQDTEVGYIALKMRH
jgi:hypothetical protein